MVIPYEQYRWIGQSFPYPNEREEEGFYQMAANLIYAGVQTVLWFSQKRIFVMTWTKPSVQ